MLKTILGLLGWLGTALVLAAAAIRFIRPEWQPVGYWLAVSGLVCLLLYMLGQWREVARLFGRKQARYGAVALTSVLLVLGILVAINYMASRHSQRWDLTAGQVFTLSDQTRRVLESLEQPVNVLVFARENDFGRFRNRLTEYEHVTDQVSVEYIDIDRNPARARQYEIQSYGTVVIEHAGRIERVTSDAEQELTNALIKAVEGTEPKVYFVEGHGEKSITSAEREGYNAISEALGGDNFLVESLVLAQQPDVPDDASVVVIAGPQNDYLATEIDALRRYLNRGGKVLLLLDPPDTSEAPELTQLVELASGWGFEVGNNVVVDVSGIGQLLGTDASVPVAASYPSHPITERFGVLTAYPLARSVRPVSGGTDGRTAQSFIETGERSWAETDIQTLLASGQVALDEEQGDQAGPISIGAAVSTDAPEPPVAADNDGEAKAAEGQAGAAEAAGGDDAPTPQTRMVVIGDSDFAANFALGIQGNRDLFLNAVNWLAQQENLIAIRPREPEDRRITLTADQQQRIFWISLVIIPGLVLGSGVYTWWRRR